MLLWLVNLGLTGELPVKFGIVSGVFYCNDNNVILEEKNLYNGKGEKIGWSHTMLKIILLMKI